MHDRRKGQSHFVLHSDHFESFLNHPMISADAPLSRGCHPHPPSCHDKESLVGTECFRCIETEEAEVGHQKIHAPDEESMQEKASFLLHGENGPEAMPDASVKGEKFEEELVPHQFSPEAMDEIKGQTTQGKEKKGVTDDVGCSLDLGPEHIVEKTSKGVDVREEGKNKKEKEDHHVDGTLHKDGPEEFPDRDPFDAIEGCTARELSQSWKGQVH